MERTTRRSFVVQVAAGSSALLVSGVMAQAAVAPKLEEKDPQAAALGYVQDSTKVDLKKYPKYMADQKCASCQLFAGKPKDPSGPCPLFAGKQVAATGWCSAYVKKAA